MRRSFCFILSMCLSLGGVVWRGESAGAGRVVGRVAASRGVVEPTRRALLVGISKYRRGMSVAAEWDDLNAEPDVDALRDVLVSKFQFRAADIRVLKTGAETTHAAIVEAFRRVLIEPAQAGDIIYFHYSGHGGQVPDTDVRGNPFVGDELDGLDEGLIPSDYVSKQDGSRTIRDDQLGLLLDELRRKRPANVTVSVDSCFSGTVTRGGRFKVRGQRWAGKPPVTPATRAQGGGMAESAGGILTRGEAVANGYVVISATRHDELASEYEDEHGQVRGLLSYALVRAFAEATPETTYREIFERINEEITADNAEQNPQLEGDIDKVLMSGAALPAPAYTPVVVNRDGRLTLQAGALQGMTVGSRFALFPTATRDFKTASPLAEADIVQLASTVAELKLTDASAARGVKPHDLHAARAVETLHRYDDRRLRVALANFDAPARVQQLRDMLATLPHVSVAATHERWDVRLCDGRCPDEKPSATRATPVTDATTAAGAVVLQREDGSVIASLAGGAGQSERIKNKLAGESRWRFLNALANRDPNSQVSISLRLVPVAVEADALTGDLRIVGDLTGARTEGGQLELQEGEHVVVELRNDGAADAFVTVLNLLNDGSVKPIWPIHGQRTGRDNKIPNDRKWYRVPMPARPYIFRIEPPFGKEIYKAFATLAPTDFSPLLDAALDDRAFDAEARRAAASPIGQLLMSAVRGTSVRRNDLTRSDWATAVVIFNVKPRS